MYVFEFTDNYIIIYNKKNKKIIAVPIDSGIIVNNKLYDYLKLVNVLNKIVNKYKFSNSLFRIKVKILLFQKVSPSELYLLRNVFKFTSNILVEVVNVNKFFKDKYLLISGNEVYYNNRKMKKLNLNEYILVGYSDHFQIIKDNLRKKFNINILEYENSDTIIYENV